MKKTVVVAASLLAACGVADGPLGVSPEFDLRANASYTRLEIGDTLMVAFTVRNSTGPHSCALHLVDTSGTRIPITATAVGSNAGVYRWPIPDSILLDGARRAFPAFQSFAVSISDPEGTIDKRESGRIFYIAGRPHSDEGVVVVNSRNGGERYRIGDTLRVRFSSVSGDEVSCTVELLWGSQSHSLTHEESVSSLDGVFPVELPDSIYDRSNNLVPFPTGSDFRVEVREYGMGSSSDRSDAVFSIAK